MFDIIAASFFQKKSCLLPGIGQLTFANTAAETDFINSKILPPRQSIVFIPASAQTEPVFNEFSAISELLLSKLDTEGNADITGVGSFTKKDDGRFHFIPVEPDPAFLQPIKAIRIVRQDAEHSILVGDKETTSTVMTEMLHVDEAAVLKKSWWWIWAVVGFAIAVGALGYYIYTFGFNYLGSRLP